MTTTLEDLQNWKEGTICTLDVSSKIEITKLGGLKDLTLPPVIQHLILTGARIDEVTYILDGFLKNCTSLKTLDISQLVNVTRVGESFLEGCSSLRSLNLDPLGKVTKIHKRFLFGCSGLEELDLTPLKSVTESVNEFLVGCMSLKTLDLSPLKKVKYISNSFLERCSSLKTLDLSPLNEVTQIDKGFLDSCSALTSLDLSPLNNVTKVGKGFLGGCGSLTTIDLSPLSNVTEIDELSEGLLEYCKSLTTLDLRPLRKMKKIQNGFLSGCSALRELDLTPLEDITKVDGGMLSGCGSLKTLDLRPLRKITQIGAGFLSECSALRELDLSPMNKVTQIGNRFLADCGSLEDVNLSSLKGKAKIGDEFLSGCSALEFLDLTPLSEVTQIGNEFLQGCTSIKKLVVNSEIVRSALGDLKKYATSEHEASDTSNPNTATSTNNGDASLPKDEEEVEVEEEKPPELPESYTSKAAQMLSSPGLHEDKARKSIDKALELHPQCPDGLDTLAALTVQSMEDPIKRLVDIEDVISTALQAENPNLNKYFIDDSQSSVSKVYEGMSVELLDSLFQRVDDFMKTSIKDLEDSHNDVKEDIARVKDSCAEMKEQLKERSDRMKLSEMISDEYAQRLNDLEYRMQNCETCHKSIKGELNFLKQNVTDTNEKFEAALIWDGYQPVGKGAQEYYKGFVTHMSGTFIEVLRCNPFRQVPGGPPTSATRFSECVSAVTSTVPVFGELAAQILKLISEFVDKVKGEQKRKKLNRLLSFGLNTQFCFDMLATHTAKEIIAKREKELNDLGTYEEENSKSFKETLKGLIKAPIDTLEGLFEKDQVSVPQALGQADAEWILRYLQRKQVPGNLKTTCTHGKGNLTKDYFKRVSRSLAKALIDKNKYRLNRMVNLRIKKCLTVPQDLSRKHLTCAAKCGDDSAVARLGHVQDGEVVFDYPMYITIISDEAIETVEFEIPGVGKGSLKITSVVQKNEKRREARVTLSDGSKQAELLVNIVTHNFDLGGDKNVALKKK
eukprot:TRINITY_DN1715_c0_g1_i1.p1 TRINITY_DN1715_c0_g1~~TRINITY_DN1715_c0_g1_i1.p1  ORF type:complete len:1015 (+),score=134.96 TRINITY_DN1715_c0_g1_i1:1153-4197(+)